MGALVEIDPPRRPDEQRAHALLAQGLPASWLVTTNIYEWHFVGRGVTEIDSIVICPRGVFLLDLKHFRGPITPMTARPWDGIPTDRQKRGNPLQVIQNDVFRLKNDLLGSYDSELLEKVWIEPAVVLSHPDAILDWASSDLPEKMRSHIFTLAQAIGGLEKLASQGRPLRANHAKKIVVALKARTSIPDSFFQGADWCTQYVHSTTLPEKTIRDTAPPPSESAIERQRYRTKLKKEANKIADLVDGCWRSFSEIYHFVVPYDGTDIRDKVSDGLRPLEDRAWRKWVDGFHKLSRRERVRLFTMIDRFRAATEPLQPVRRQYYAMDDPPCRVTPASRASWIPNSLQEDVSCIQHLLSCVWSEREQMVGTIYRSASHEFRSQNLKMWFRNFSKSLELFEEAAELGDKESEICASLMRRWGAPKRSSRFEGEIPLCNDSTYRGRWESELRLGK
jgi:hypothetical protein